ncbi:hypothetical protein BDY21DRAFT_335130 [Lineolata rhizophorae]|uniref:DNA repair protein rhp7 treble clef domain-containing protein n=1 Tax=Lineolata rhizophorae TaxID=578093 RepID=A0A6A6P980_9PEZI|nr:hypothetical protein BDY21DRAFT_335130 [Lineolata rhizophorae]
MSTRRAGSNRIRGPHSALTDFLAAHNISAAQIRADYNRRRGQEGENRENRGNDQNGENGNGQENGVATPGDADAVDAQPTQAAANGNASGLLENLNLDEEESEQEDEAPQPSASRKRKRTGEKAKQKEKGKEKESKKKPKKGNAKKKKGQDDGDDDDDDDYEDDFLDMYKKAPPPPGQLEYCEICGKRFTVTPYSKTGPQGGLVCTPCGKQLAKDAKAENNKNKPKKAAANRRSRRKMESDRLDGRSTFGAKSLLQLCIEKVVQHHNDIEEFGDLPPKVLERLSEIFSKNRVLNSRTIKLFLRPDLDTVALHDCAYIETEDYDQIFAISQNVKKLVLRNACQFKDENVEYMIGKATKLEYLQLYASNLVSNTMWIKLFQERGKQFSAVKLQWLDAAFDDDAVEAMVANCPKLERVKLKYCRKVGRRSIDALAKLPKLQHLSLLMSQEVSAESVVGLISRVGHNLRTLSLEKFIDADDTVLAAIHQHCRHLRKLRFTGNECCTEAAYASLFTDWANVPLHFVDLSSTRDVDNSNPDGPQDEPVGLGAASFDALVRHSGPELRHLQVTSCRHVPLAAFMDAFDGKKCYPQLKEVNISFCTQADTTVVAGIFRSCPRLERVIAFGCFNVADVIVPRGVSLIGVPRAQEAIEQLGTAVWEAGTGMDGAKGSAKLLERLF